MYSDLHTVASSIYSKVTKGYEDFGNSPILIIN